MATQSISDRKVIAGTTRLTQRLDNDYRIDREVQKSVSFTGVTGIRAQDAMVTESAGAIVDRTREHLGTSDRAVVALRRSLIEAATLCNSTGEPPSAVGKPWLYSVRATQAVLPGASNPEDSEELMGAARAQDLNLDQSFG